MFFTHINSYARSDAGMATAVDAFNRLNETIIDSERKLAEATAINRDRAALISIVREGRKLRFGFVRNGTLTFIETIGTWDDNVEAWREALLSPIKQGTTDGN